MQKYDLIIVGAGAAGMLAAIQANAEAPQLRIALLERLPRPGKKLLATGNGRCNIANAAASREHYYNAAGQNPAFVCSRPCNNIPNKIIWPSSEAWAC